MSDNKKEFYTPQPGSIPQQGSEKLLHIIFIVDVSGSMKGDGRIEAVNEAFTQMIPALRQIQMDCMSEFELKLSIMTFDQDARWVVMPTPIMEYNHQDIDCSQWVTYYSNAFRLLGEKLSRKEFMAHTGKIAAPYIMFLTDGEPSKGDPYDTELDKLLDNGWFTNSLRYAVLIGSEAMYSASARDAVSRFVKDPEEGIIDAVDAATLAAEVQAKTLHTVKIATQHNPTFDDDDVPSEDDDYPLDDDDNDPLDDDDPFKNAYKGGDFI